MSYSNQKTKIVVKKAGAIFLCMCFAISVVSCSSISSTSSTVKGDAKSSSSLSSQQDTPSSSASSQQIGDKNSADVTITIPASMLKGKNPDSSIKEAKEKGVGEVIKNKDGSLTYKMNKSTHEKMMDEIKKSLISSIDEIKSSKDFKSIKDITYNDDFSQFTIVVDQAKYQNSMDGFAALGLYIACAYYQTFNGVDVKNFKTTFTIQDESTKKTVSTIIYPDALNTKK